MGIVPPALLFMAVIAVAALGETAWAAGSAAPAADVVSVLLAGAFGSVSRGWVERDPATEDTVIPDARIVGRRSHAAGPALVPAGRTPARAAEDDKPRLLVTVRVEMTYGMLKGRAYAGHFTLSRCQTASARRRSDSAHVIPLDGFAFKFDSRAYGDGDFEGFAGSPSFAFVRTAEGHLQLQGSTRDRYLAFMPNGATTTVMKFDAPGNVISVGHATLEVTSLGGRER